MIIDMAMGAFGGVLKDGLGYLKFNPGPGNGVSSLVLWRERLGLWQKAPDDTNIEGKRKDVSRRQIHESRPNQSFNAQLIPGLGTGNASTFVNQLTKKMAA